MPINAVIDVKEETPLYGYTEPVTVEEFKSYAKIDFDDDDALIAVMLVAVREDIEKYLGVSIVQKYLTVILNNGCGGIEIPYGPTPDEIDVTTILAIDGEPFNESLIQIIGTDFKYLNSPVNCYVKMSYTAGYVSVWQSLTEGGVPLPEAIKFAIKAECFARYESRGEKLDAGSKGSTASYICDASKQFCNKYKRNTELSL